MGRHEAPRSAKKWVFGWAVGSMVVVTGAAVAGSIAIFLSSQFGSGVSNTTTGCDTTLTFDFGTPTYSQAAGDYTFTTVDYDGLDVPACDTQVMRVTVIDTNELALGDASLTVDDTSPNQAPGTVTPSAGTLTLSQPVAVNQADRVVAAITNN